MEEVVEQALRSDGIEGSQAMQTPEDVQAMLKLASLGWGAKRIASEMGCSGNTCGATCAKAAGSRTGHRHGQAG